MQKTFAMHRVLAHELKDLLVNTVKTVADPQLKAMVLYSRKQSLDGDADVFWLRGILAGVHAHDEAGSQ